MRKLLLILLLAASPAWGAVKYVDNSGSPACDDTPGNGSEAAPWCTIAYSITQISGGDTVNVKQGTYNEIFTITGVDGTSGNPTIYQAFPGDTPTIDNAGASRVKILDSAWVTFNGFIVTDMNQGVFIENSNNIVFTNNTVFNIEQEGVRVKLDSFNILIEGNTVHTTGTNEFNGECFYIGSAGGENDQSHDITIRNNIIHDCDDEGIELKPSLYNAIVEGNILYNVNTGSSTVGSIEVNQEEDRGQNPNHIVRNNIIYDSDTAIRAGTGVTVYNNVIWGLTAGHYGIYVDNLEADGYTRIIYHNTINESTGDAVNVDSGATDIQNNIGPATAGNNIAFNSAFFFDVTNDDYHIVTGSSPIDLGADLTSTVPTDIDGKTRPSVTPDAGAYEVVDDHYAAGCTVANAQAVIDATAEGERALLPPCSATWSSVVTVENKGITLQGAGIDVTTITLGAGITILLFTLDVGDSTTDVSGFTWDANDVDPGAALLININGGGLDAFRMHHMKFENLVGGAIGVNADGNVLGALIDNITFNMPTSSGSKAVRSFGADGGDMSPWTFAFGLGTEKFLFVEDCTFNYGNGNDGAFDAYHGSRIVFRYNTVNETTVGNHGADSGGYRGTHSFEIYENTFDKTSGGDIRLGYWRSGSGVIYNNTYTGNYSSMALTIYRSDESHAPWGQCNGSAPWDENQSGKAGYACLDQSGHIFTDSSGGSNTLVGIYEWGNTLDAADVDFSINGHASGPYFTEDVDYFNDTVKPEYTAFTYPHPLQGVGNGNGNGVGTTISGAVTISGTVEIQ